MRVELYQDKNDGEKFRDILLLAKYARVFSFQVDVYYSPEGVRLLVALEAQKLHIRLFTVCDRGHKHYCDQHGFPESWPAGFAIGDVNHADCYPAAHAKTQRARSETA